MRDYLYNIFKWFTIITCTLYQSRPETFHLSYLKFFLDFIYLFLERGKHQCVVPDWGPDLQPKNVPYWESNWRPFASQACTQSTELHQPGLFSFFLKDVVYLFLERGKGKEKERERNINVWFPFTHSQLGTWPKTQACILTGYRTCEPLVHRPLLNTLSHTSQGSSSLNFVYASEDYFLLMTQIFNLEIYCIHLKSSFPLIDLLILKII